jgi:hypothetical protein
MLLRRHCARVRFKTVDLALREAIMTEVKVGIG